MIDRTKRKINGMPSDRDRQDGDGIDGYARNESKVLV